MRRTTLSITILFSLLFPYSVSATFTDVPTNHQYKRAVDYLEERNLVKGFEDGSFRPKKKLTQAEFLTFLLNATGNADEYESNDSPTFDDVPLDVWFYKPVETAFQMGIIQKNSGHNNFFPGKFVNKARALELLFQLYNIELLSARDDETVFKDLRKITNYSNIAKTAKQYGILEQDGPQYFRAFKVVSRGELADYIYRIENFGKTELFARNTKDISNINYDSSLFTQKEFKILVDIWDRVHKDYLHKDDLSDKELIEAAIQGIITELDDPYTNYQEPAKATDFVNNLDGNLEGIGIEINKLNEKVTIVSVIKGSPAESAGLEAKDVIKKINNKDITEKSLAEIANLIRGKAGSKVKLSISRNGASKSFTVTRAKLNLPEVTSKMLEDEIGLISISTFSSTAAQDFLTELSDLRTLGARGIILDLRNNPGGFLNTAIQIASLIIPKNKAITSIYTASNDSSTNFSTGPYLLNGRHLVVLINKGSASASEIIAAAVKEHKAGLVVGETSFGKGTVQDIAYYSDGSFLKMTVAQWLTPSGNNVNNKGVKPDFSVKNTSKDDVQLNKAIQILRDKLKD